MAQQFKRLQRIYRFHIIDGYRSVEEINAGYGKNQRGAYWPAKGLTPCPKAKAESRKLKSITVFRRSVLGVQLLLQFVTGNLQPALSAEQTENSISEWT